MADLRRLALDRRSVCPSSADLARRSSLIISDRPVSRTCFRNPISSIGSSGNRTPRSIVYGKWKSPASRSKTPMSTTWVSKISWILSPTRSYIACMSSSAASPSWTLLMIASSAARWSVSVRRRFVSSNSRAFSRATPMLDASVLSSRSSASRRRRRRMLSSATVAEDPLAGEDRHAEPGLGRRSRPDRPGRPRRPASCAGSRSGSGARPDDRRAGQPGPELDRSRGRTARLRRCRTGSGSRSVVVVVQRDVQRIAPRRSARTRSPTSSMIAAKSSCFARASPMSLMTASSALRWSVSVSRRFVSSNSRAFSRATPMLEASVPRSRSSPS